MNLELNVTKVKEKEKRKRNLRTHSSKVTRNSEGHTSHCQLVLRTSKKMKEKKRNKSRRKRRKRQNKILNVETKLTVTTVVLNIEQNE